MPFILLFYILPLRLEKKHIKENDNVTRINYVCP
jgi:hypothetical protein